MSEKTLYKCDECGVTKATNYNRPISWKNVSWHTKAKGRKNAVYHDKDYCPKCARKKGI